MSAAPYFSRFGRVLTLAEVMADTASFMNAREIAGVLARLGYDVAALNDEAVASEIDARCEVALLQMATALR
jgi:hypothetical protein